MDPLKTKAYGIFRSELEKHLNSIASMFLSATPPCAEDFSAARIMVHNIKGGAGFFGFSQLAAVASSIEDICKLPAAEAIAQIDVFISQFSKLQIEVSKLPENVR